MSLFALTLAFAGDISLGLDLPTFSLDLVSCLVAPLLGLLPRVTLLSDAVMVSFFILLLLATALLDLPRSPPAFEACFYALVLTIDGVHSSGIMVFFVMSGGMLSGLGVGGVEIVLVAGAVLSSLAVLLEYRAAVCVDAVAKNQAATKDLLDKAGHGFCSVDAATGLISIASPKLERTLGAQGGLVGRRFHGFVMEADEHRVQALCLAAQTGGRVLESLLVTCRVPGRDQGEEPNELLVFEAKLLPHVIDNGEFCICVQVQGEARLQATGPQQPVAPAPAFTVAPLPDPDDQLSLVSTFALSMSQDAGQEAPHHRPFTAGPVQPRRCVDASTQTAGGKPPLRARVEGPPRPLAAGSQRPRWRSRLRVHSNTRERLLPQFQPTPGHTVRLVIADTLRSFNVQGRGCCTWHVLWKAVLHEAYEQECQPGFEPYTGFQCSRCLAMNEWDVDETDDLEDEVCTYCGGRPRAQAESGVVSSTGEAADTEVPSSVARSSVSAAPRTQRVAALATHTLDLSPL